MKTDSVFSLIQTEIDNLSVMITITVVCVRYIIYSILMENESNFLVKFASVQIKLSILNLIQNNTEVNYSITNIQHQMNNPNKKIIYGKL